MNYNLFNEYLKYINSILRNTFEYQYFIVTAGAFQNLSLYYKNNS